MVLVAHDEKSLFGQMLAHPNLVKDTLHHTHDALNHLQIVHHHTHGGRAHRQIAQHVHITTERLDVLAIATAVADHAIVEDFLVETAEAAAEKVVS